MKIALISLLGLISFTTFSQEETIVVVRQDDYRRKKKSTDRNVENYNAFKFDPFRMAIGEIGFSWEHRIEEKTTVEFELGPTISNLTNSGFHDQYNYGSSHSAMGVLVSAAVRYYPLEDYQAMNKLYISPKFKYRRFNQAYDVAINGTGLSEQMGYTNEYIFSFNLGFQQWLSNNFAFDYYIGAGIGSIQGKTYNYVYGDMGQYTWQSSPIRDAKFLGVIGMKVTIGN